MMIVVMSGADSREAEVAGTPAPEPEPHDARHTVAEPPPEQLHEARGADDRPCRLTLPDGTVQHEGTVASCIEVAERLWWDAERGATAQERTATKHRAASVQFEVAGDEGWHADRSLATRITEAHLPPDVT